MPAKPDCDVINRSIEKLRNKRFQSLRFSQPLEAQFEQDTAKERCYRLWLEGLLAIIFLNGCLLFDYVMVKDVRWESIVLRTMLVTPLALLVNLLMRLNPRRALREGSVAAGTTLICFINLYVEGNTTASTTTYGLICVLITVLFVDVVMRIRLRYAAISTGVMTVGGLCFLADATGLENPEKIVAASLLAIGVAITMTASYSLEREERLGYLMHLRSEVQGRTLEALNSELQQLSNVDKLTGLPNRRAFEERFENLWAEGERLRTCLSAIIFDVDHFKRLNDRHGHLYGDEVLQHIAGLLVQGLQGHGDFTARFGGEEFVVLLPDTELEKALLLAERVRSLVEVSGKSVTGEPFGNTVLWATVSCGVAMCVPGVGMYRDDLLEAADRALYDAKARGRNRVSFQMRVPESVVT